MFSRKGKWAVVCSVLLLGSIFSPGFCFAGTKRVSPVDNPDDAVSRLVDRDTEMVFEMIGSGSSARWFLKASANFKYTVVMKATSKILKKEKLSRGRWKIEELHKITMAADSLQTSQEDLRLQLDTFDFQSFSAFVNVASISFAAAGFPSAALILKGAELVGEAILGPLDGLPMNAFSSYAKVFLQNKFDGTFGAKLRRCNGREYKVVYMLNGNNLPIDVKYTYADGREVEDDEEILVLKRLNVFMDSHTVPNRKCVVGDVWAIHSEDIEQVMDPYVDGNYAGDINVERIANDPDGIWNIGMKQATLAIISDDGNTTGNIKLSEGRAKVEPTHCTVTEIHVKGSAKMSSVTRHHWLFRATVDGWCRFTGHLTSKPASKQVK